MNPYMCEGKVIAPPNKRLAGNSNASANALISDLDAELFKSSDRAGPVIMVSSISSSGALLNVLDQPFISLAQMRNSALGLCIYENSDVTISAVYIYSR